MKVSANFLKGLSKEKYLSYIRSLPNIHEEKVQTYATVILTFLAISFFGIFAISPTLSTIAVLRKTVEDSKFLDFQLQSKITNMTKLQSSFSSISPQLPVLYSAIPQSPQVGKLSGQIRTLAQDSGVTLDQLQVQSTEIASSGKPKSVLKPIMINIGVKGDFESFKKFYDSLTDFDRLLTVSSMSVVVPTELDTSKYRLTILVETYYRP